jgi:hypothetical protein
MRYTGDSREICDQLIEIDEEEQPLPKGEMWAKIALTERLINKVIEHKLQLVRALVLGVLKLIEYLY